MGEKINTKTDFCKKGSKTTLEGTSNFTEEFL